GLAEGGDQLRQARDRLACRLVELAARIAPIAADADGDQRMGASPLLHRLPADAKLAGDVARGHGAAGGGERFEAMLGAARDERGERIEIDDGGADSGGLRKHAGYGA